MDNSVKKSLVTSGRRIRAGVVFAVIMGIFGVLFAGANGWIDMSRLFGICGFKQVYGLPCPTCYITTSAMAFVQGRIAESFYVQPAGAVLCCALVAAQVVALLISAFGVNFAFLRKPFGWRMIVYFLVSALIVLVAGWIVTLSRALVGNGGF